MARTDVDIDELDLIPIDPIPSYAWSQDMADFAESISDGAVRRSLLGLASHLGSRRVGLHAIRDLAAAPGIQAQSPQRKW